MPLFQIIFFEEQAAGIGKRWVSLEWKNRRELLGAGFCVVWIWFSVSHHPFIAASCSAKIVIHLHPVPANKEPGPYQHSKYSFIRLSFKEHGQIEVVPCTQPATLYNKPFYNPVWRVPVFFVSLQFFRRLTEEMTQKRWENTPVSQPIPTGTGSQVRNSSDNLIWISIKMKDRCQSAIYY